MLKNNIFTFEKTTLKQKRGTAIGNKLAPPYSILLTAELEKINKVHPTTKFKAE